MKLPQPHTETAPIARNSGSELLEEAFARYQSELLGMLYCMVGNREDARDAVQEAFLKCWKHTDQVPELDNLKAWIFHIALNTGRDLRKTAWRRKRKTYPGGESMLTSHEPSVAVQMEQDEQVGRVRRALHDLRTEEQEVFLLRQNGDMTYEQIATAIDIPIGTVKTRMRRALVSLRRVLVEE